MAKKTTTRQTQTTRIAGKRVRIVTTTSASGTKVTVKAAPIEEWILQAAAVRALKAMPEYAASAERVAANDNAARPSFTIAGDMNGDYRSKRAAVKASATGIAAGDPDLRVYLPNGVLRLIEYKNAEGKPTASQKIRHPLLAALGHPVETLKVATEEEAAATSVELVRGWLAEAASVAA
ncbi:VRR-NUC domain-containing protein [Sinorhizobium meliloti]|uniref:VRR-NUC domain-containing protein n=1 Tax=Rhizobium meliloti TaxID=382 RepID=UPI000FDBD042|nr:VRR-NUC domain-containing protein [Sinorhizobium meliloti]RVL38001.1 VRR-NUC domain-containing protein [Sinorhizobium meliloti]